MLAWAPANRWLLNGDSCSVVSQWHKLGFATQDTIAFDRWMEEGYVSIQKACSPEHSIEEEEGHSGPHVTLQFRRSVYVDESDEQRK